VNEKTVRVAPQKIMFVGTAGLRLAVYVNDRVLALPPGEWRDSAWFGSPAGWRPFTTARCSDASERSTNGSFSPALLTEGFELAVTCEEARPSEGTAPPRGVYTFILERESDGAPVARLFDCLAVPSALGADARLSDLVLANIGGQQQ